jgi:hypothetical protein
MITVNNYNKQSKKRITKFKIKDSQLSPTQVKVLAIRKFDTLLYDFILSSLYDKSLLIYHQMGKLNDMFSNYINIFNKARQRNFHIKKNMKKAKKEEIYLEDYLF